MVRNGAGILKALRLDQDHLDVYKRQGCSNEEQLLAAEQAERPALIEHEAQLQDVYKRQGVFYA